MVRVPFPLELLEAFGDLSQVLRQAVQGFLFELLRYIAIEGFCDGACHAELGGGRSAPLVPIW